MEQPDPLDAAPWHLAHSNRSTYGSRLAARTAATRPLGEPPYRRHGPFRRSLGSTSARRSVQLRTRQGSLRPESTDSWSLGCPTAGRNEQRHDVARSEPEAEENTEGCGHWDLGRPDVPNRDQKVEEPKAASSPAGATGEAAATLALSPPGGVMWDPLKVTTEPIVGALKAKLCKVDGAIRSIKIAI
ncbi:hypothetical protein L596_003408 [Steinernema carpocapsae]|uniref:Uncharacterized protein n=1 Tax=Steinernema carpocapsae TaxID=34508 RepID=A0A4U8UTH1_STECR|nr:hypothetical protein L596_003408 [Steinernema carpocapsae]